MNKRWLLRAATVLGVCIAALLITTPAMAKWSWSDCDPILDIEGHTVSLLASIEGDPAQIRGEILFNVSLPRGTDVSVVYCEPNARVKINYSNAGGWDDDDCWSRRNNSHAIPVSVSVDINSKTKFNTRLEITLDGEQVAQDQGTTRGKLSCNFTIQ